MALTRRVWRQEFDLERRRMSERTVGFREAFVVGEFRVLWIAQAQSSQPSPKT
jgi:hypothetical protein